MFIKVHDYLIEGFIGEHAFDLINQVLVLGEVFLSEDQKLFENYFWHTGEAALQNWFYLPESSAFYESIGIESDNPDAEEEQIDLKHRGVLKAEVPDFDEGFDGKISRIGFIDILK